MTGTIDITQLLGRKEVELDSASIFETLNNKTVLVTGAGGSIGSEICRQVMKYGPKKLVLLGHGENSIYEIEMELIESEIERTIEIVGVIADVQDYEKIESIFRKHEPDVIYHAAAHKHVPLMEKNPSEAIKNNVFGTRNVARAASQLRAKTFVMISTDKAVNPTNVMGASKRMAEMVIQGLDKISKTKFVAVRFGNVLGSRGSVVPRFLKQIKKGGPITVTHPEMTRFFMTIPEASRLVIQAGTLANGGEIFVLDMGESVKINDLAIKMIDIFEERATFDIFSPRNIKIVYTGLRPGEKMYEELMMNEEGLTSTSHKKIFVGQPMDINLDHLDWKIDNLADCFLDDYLLKHRIKEIVPTYQLKGAN